MEQQYSTIQLVPCGLNQLIVTEETSYKEALLLEMSEVLIVILMKFEIT